MPLMLMEHKHRLPSYVRGLTLSLCSLRGEKDYSAAMSLALVVFDLDGTLIDSGTDLANATNALLEELGGARLPDAAVVDMVGEGAAVLVRRALIASGLDPDFPGALDRFLVHYEERLLDQTQPYAGVLEMLERIAMRTRLAVLTNKPAAATERILDGLGLTRFFKMVIGGDSPLGRKPTPAGLLHLAASAGTGPADTLMVGDSPIDLHTARQAGTRVCLARYGFGYRFSETDFRGDEQFIDAPRDLDRLVEQEIRRGV
jgi:phosphoglycolate phosphatase